MTTDKRIMTFISTQKLKRNAEGRIVSGSASIVQNKYVKDREYHSAHVTIEKLGKVLYLSDDKKEGIFQSPIRGLVEYNSAKNEFKDVSLSDPRLSGSIVNFQTNIHTVFGDSYLLLMFLKKNGFLSLFSKLFEKNIDYQRHICHVVHGIITENGKMKCDDYIEKSFLSHTIPGISIPSLCSDTQYFTLMGNDKLRTNFFMSYVEKMKKHNSGFGRGCYVDSTPLPNEIKCFPFVATSSHGINTAKNQIRLVMVLDEQTGMPIWYDIIAGNINDVNTLEPIGADVAETLGVELYSYVLDSGYVSRELIENIHVGSEKRFLGLMPNRLGYLKRKDIFNEFRNDFNNPEYIFMENGSDYFGVRKQVMLFNCCEYAYIFVDRAKAHNEYRSYMSEKWDEYSASSNDEKEWKSIEGGFFVLISNELKDPRDILSEYHKRTRIESVFKTGKQYLNLLPIAKWTPETIRGKLLLDVMNTIIYLSMLKEKGDSKLYLNKILSTTQSLICTHTKDDILMIDYPTVNVKKSYKAFNVEVPTYIELKKFKKSIMFK